MSHVGCFLLVLLAGADAGVTSGIGRGPYVDPDPDQSGRVFPSPKGEEPLRFPVTVSAPTVDSREVDVALLGKYVQGRKDGLQACYEREAKRQGFDVDKAHALKVSWRISELGRAIDITSSGPVADTPVGACIRSVMRAWILPFKLGSPAAVTMDLSWAREKKAR